MNMIFFFFTKMGFSPHKAELLLQSMDLKNEKLIGKLIRINPNKSLKTGLKSIYFIDEMNQDLWITFLYDGLWNYICQSSCNQTIV